MTNEDYMKKANIDDLASFLVEKFFLDYDVEGLSQEKIYFSDYKTSVKEMKSWLQKEYKE